MDSFRRDDTERPPSSWVSFVIKGEREVDPLRLSEGVPRKMPPSSWVRSASSGGKEPPPIPSRETEQISLQTGRGCTRL